MSAITAGDCGSCWAFAATGSLEGQIFRKNGKAVSLSEQNLIDCSTSNDGCDGGFPELAFKYVMSNGGVESEDSYPYEAVNANCRYEPNNSEAAVKAFGMITTENEDELKEAVATIGPSKF